MSPIKNALLCPKRSNAIKQNIVSYFFPSFSYKFPLLILVSERPELATAVLFLLLP